MKTIKSPKLLLLAGLLSLALAGCGNSSSVKTAPATEQLFYAYSVVFDHHSSLWGAGYNGYGQLGNGSLATSSIFIPVYKPAGMGPILGYAAGANHVVAFSNNSTIWTWGSNFRSRLGLGTAVPTSGGSAFSGYPAVVQIPGIKNKVVSVAAGWLHTLAVAGPNRSVVAWGANNLGQLGNLDNSLNDAPLPVPVRGPNGSGNLENIEQVAAGGSHSLALGTDGTVWAWGDNAWGQVGKVGSPFYAFPEQVNFPAGVRIRKIAAAGSYSLARDTDGHVWAWGYSAYGQLGNGPAGPQDLGKEELGKQDLLPHYTPVQVQVATRDAQGKVISTSPLVAEDISAGLMHVLALVKNGGKNEVWSWGFNEKGQLGLGEKGLAVSYAGKATATLLDNLITNSSTGATRIYAFGNQSMAQINGIWYGWGDNGSGELGQPVDNKTLGYKVQPVQPIGLPGAE